MEQEIKNHMHRLVNEHIQAEDLRALLQAWIEDKSQETSVWSDLTLCCHYMLGGSSPQIQRIAAAAELVILTLDIVDDLQDQDQPGKPWMQCPPAYALNGILAFYAAFMAELGRLGIPGPALTEIGRLLSRSVNGQQKDVNGSAATAEDYLLLNQEKSGSIFRLAFHMGCIGLEVPPGTLERLDELADCIGLLHQIENDKRDIVRLDLKNDLYGRKRTLPILYLLCNEDPEFLLVQDYYKGAYTPEYMGAHKAEVLKLIEDSGCLEYAGVVQSLCLQKIEEQYEGLEALPDWKKKFRELTFGTYL